MFPFIWITIALAVLWRYFRRVYSRFSTYGVKHFWVVPPLGNMLPVILKKEHVAYNIDRMYRIFSGERFIGRYEFMNPSVLLIDLELIKKVTIEDFVHFHDHKNFTDATLDPLFGRNLFSLTGQEWKEMRLFLSPAFTSAKIRHMVPYMEQVSIQMVETLKDNFQKSQSTHIEVDSKDLTTRATSDVIASCAFGLKTDSFKEPNNPFYSMAKITASFNLRQFILVFCYARFPTLCRILNLTLLTKETVKFYKDLVLNTIQYRKAQNIIRPDMIHLLMEAKKGTLDTQVHKSDSNNKIKDAGFASVEESTSTYRSNYKDLSEVDLVAQTVIFLVGGFETVSAALTFTLYELAMNPGTQDKLAAEIKAFDAKYKGKIDYDLISSMNYLDMVISEVLRIWPPLTLLDRLCVKQYNLGKPHTNATNEFIDIQVSLMLSRVLILPPVWKADSTEKSRQETQQLLFSGKENVTVSKGEIVNIPVWSLHHDPKYFPDPERFDPERFSIQNRQLINPLTYMPFGIGPRNCIASRFALCELKVFLYHLIKEMEVSPSSNTRYPDKMSAESFNPRFENGHWLRFKIRCSNDVTTA